MPSKKKGLMGKLLRMNARWFLGALICTLVCVVTDYLSPLIVAETLDRYLGNQESVLPPILLRLMPVLSDRAYIVERLYLVGLLIILLSLIIKPILSIALLAAIAGVCYFAYQGNLGVSVQSFIQGVLQSIQDLLGRAIAWVRSAPQIHLP